MLSSPDSHVTQPLSHQHDTFVGTSLSPPSHRSLPNTPVPATQLQAPLTTIKLPLVIPATEKRERPSSEQGTGSKQPGVLPVSAFLEIRPYRPMVGLGVLCGTIVMLMLASFFVTPLDNDQ